MTVTQPRFFIDVSSALLQRVGLLLALIMTAVAAFAAGTGIGAAPPVTVTTNVLPTISLSDPAAINPSPAPSADAVWTGGTPDILNFGEIGPAETGEASLTWTVTTDNPTGYQLTVSNASGVAPMLKSGSNSIDDMSTTPTNRTSLMTQTQFGFSAGDRVGHSQASVNYAASPWGTTGGAGTQGELYRSIPVGGTKAAEQVAGPLTNDPVTLNFLMIHSASDSPAAGSYAGTLQVTASTI